MHPTRAVRPFLILCKILFLANTQENSSLMWIVIYVLRITVRLILAAMHFYLTITRESATILKVRPRLMYCINQLSYVLLFCGITLSNISKAVTMDDCLKDIEIVHLKITTRFRSSTTILWSEKRIKWWSHGQVILIIGTALVASSITAYGTVSLALEAFMYVYIEAVNNVSVLHFCNGLIILRNYFKWTSYQLEILSCTITSDLSDISTIHAQLISIAQKWNRAFSFQLLLMVGHAFAILTTSIVKVYDEFIDFGYSDITSRVLLVFRELRDEFLQIVVIIFLVVSSDSTARMANNFSVVLHSSLTWMTVCHKEISLISLQLLSSKLKFAAGNIIPIVFSLFFVIIGGVCTYVIYFFQNNNWDEVVIKY